MINTSVLAGLVATATSPRRRFARKDLTWDYPGDKVLGDCLLLLLLLMYYYVIIMYYMLLLCIIMFIVGVGS